MLLSQQLPRAPTRSSSSVFSLVRTASEQHGVASRLFKSGGSGGAQEKVTVAGAKAAKKRLDAEGKIVWVVFVT